MGADIAKVEPPHGEAGRTGFGDAYYFMMYNANKRSLTVNLKSERGLALVVKAGLMVYRRGGAKVYQLVEV